MNQIEEVKNKGKLSTFILVFCSTIFYLWIGFPLIGEVLISFIIANNGPVIIEAIDSLLFFSIILIPLSIPYSIVEMWRMYFLKNYKNACFFCALPFISLVSILYYILFVRFLEIGIMNFFEKI